MLYDVILRKLNNKYIAQAKEWPDVLVEGDSRDAALDGIKLRLVDYLTNQVEIVQVEVPLPVNAGNPWLDKFGFFKDDPTFDDLQAEIDTYRREIDLEMEQLDE